MRGRLILQNRHWLDTVYWGLVDVLARILTRLNVRYSGVGVDSKMKGVIVNRIWIALLLLVMCGSNTFSLPYATASIKKKEILSVSSSRFPVVYTPVGYLAENIRISFGDQEFINSEGPSDKLSKKQPGDTLQQLTLVYEVKPNPPYYLDEKYINWEKPGITLEILKILESRLNIKITFKRYPWRRALRFVELNQADGIFHASFIPERMAYGVYPMKFGKVDPSRRVMRNTYVLYKLKDSPLEWDGARFSHLTGGIGATLGYAIVDDLRRMGVSVEEEREQLLNLNKLVKRRVEGVAALATMMDIYIENDPQKYADVVKVSLPLSEKDYYLMLSHQFVEQNPALAEAIWDGIRDIRESKIFQEIVKKYLDGNT